VISFDELDVVVYYDNPFLTTQRFIYNVDALGGNADDLMERSYEDIVSDKIWVRNNLELEFGKLKQNQKFLISQHHMSHAASAFYPSPFESAVIVTNDGVGEWQTTTIGVGKGGKIDIVKSISYPHSLGLLYSAFTYYCGFKVNEGDYKFMGLAPYGEPVYYNLIKDNIIDVKDDGSYRLDMDYFDYHNGRTMISQKFEELFGHPRRQPESRITKFEMDIAASAQKVTEEIIIKQVQYAKKLYPNINQLCLAGGVALNCVANGKLVEKGFFDKIWIQPAAGDAGGALGAALLACYNTYGMERVVSPNDIQQGSYLGQSFSNEQAKEQLDKVNAKYHLLGEDERNEVIAHQLADEKVIGLFQGRAEFGPRALGNRSIIADPRSETMQSQLNLKIKYRESFRPFAPSVLAERASDYFELDGESPYMLLCADVRKERRIGFSLKEQLSDSDMDLLPVVNRRRSDIPAVTHVDYSARIQTVTPERNKDYYGIIKEFETITGCGVIINTSFNVRGEPIVNSPIDAYKCFMRTEMDVLVVGDYILYKDEQPVFEENIDWRDLYELD
jgi:carbamoyltransferase